ncbi:hypothetical protein BHE74_00039909 [Ensete ventricosum]|nr:hypothetical protein BHE74_00039909 [Ensete ventricosum]
MPLHSLSSLLPSHALLYPTATTSPPRDRRLQPAATLAAITGRAHRWSRPSLAAPVILDPTSVCNNEGSLPPLQRSIPPTCAATKGSLPPLQHTVPCAAAISPFLPYETADAPYTVVGHTSFSCINNDTILSSPQSQQPASIVATISALLSLSAASSVVLAALSRCHIPLMPLLSSAPAAQAAVAVAVLFLCQPRCCLPRLCRQSCEQDRPGRASPAASPPLHRCHRRAPPLCLIVTGSDLRPTVPSCPNNALLLLPQPLLADYLIAALSSSPTAAPLAIFYSNSLKEKKRRNESEKEKKTKGINAASCSPHFQSPREILLSATAARQHRHLLPRQSTPTLSVLHSAVKRQLMLHPFCCVCPRARPLSHACTHLLNHAYMTAKSTVVRPSLWLTT